MNPLQEASQFPEEGVKYDDGVVGNDGVRKPFGSCRDSGLQIDGILVDKTLANRLVGQYSLWTIGKISSSSNSKLDVA